MLIKRNDKTGRMMDWIVVEQQVWCNERGFGINYGWDGERFGSRSAAISHGFTNDRSDDFNVASLEGDVVTGFFWMEDPLTGHLAEFAEQNGLRITSR